MVVFFFSDFDVVLTEGLKTGKCKWFNGTKGWGFVTLNEGGHDVFVHQVSIQTHMRLGGT